MDGLTGLWSGRNACRSVDGRVRGTPVDQVWHVGNCAYDRLMHPLLLLDVLLTPQLVGRAWLAGCAAALRLQ